ncbi:hypothetical protein [Rhodopirellula sp. P2]|uniref:hypothetical protein n=1 Tax=Rhodopirellula sp. P2 TaxID=2127060 RepID=UPI0023686989|nr:hypothetical protein [Rhodopirellula sp. P2]WDQ15127.1 hypothetical protein PSR62_15940 [Rhodopirellula sp. P2]
MMRTGKQLAAILLAIIAILYGAWLVVSSNPTSAFADAIRDTDRIVVHARGFDEQAGKDRTVFLQITDAKAIAEFNSNIRFKRSLTGGQCACQGFPGIDWYRAGERAVFTGVQHKKAIRWSPFNYDLPLTDESAEWLANYLNMHDVPLVGLAEILPPTPVAHRHSAQPWGHDEPCVPE